MIFEEDEVVDLISKEGDRWKVRTLTAFTWHLHYQATQAILP